MTRMAAQKKLIRRVPAWLCGIFVSVMAAFYLVNATGDLALSVGLYGTPGTYKVDHCYDTNPSRKNSDYVCNGTFTPHGDPDGVSYTHLDNATNYLDGEKVEMRQGFDWGTYQATGFWPALGEIWKVGLSLCVLAFCAAQAVSPKDTSRRRPDTSWRERAAGCFALVSATGAGIALLDGVVAFASWLVGLAI